MPLGNGGYGSLRYGGQAYSGTEPYNFALTETFATTDSFDRAVSFFKTLVEAFVFNYSSIAYGELPYGAGRTGAVKFYDEVKFTPGPSVSETFQTIDSLANQPQTNYSETFQTVDSAPFFTAGLNPNETWLTSEAIMFAASVLYSETWQFADSLGNMPIIRFSETWGQSDSITNQAQLFLLEVARVGYGMGSYGQFAYAADGQGSVGFNTQLKFDISQATDETFQFDPQLGNMPIISFDEAFNTHLELFNGAILELMELAKVGYALRSYGESPYAGGSHGSVEFIERVKFDVSQFTSEALQFADSLGNQPQVNYSETFSATVSNPNFLVGLVLVEAALAMGYALGAYGQQAYGGGYNNPGAFHFGEDFKFDISHFLATDFQTDDTLSNEPRRPLTETWGQTDDITKQAQPNPQETFQTSDMFDRITQFFPNLSETWLTSDVFSQFASMFLADTWGQSDSISNQAGPHLSETWNTIDSYPNFGIGAFLVESTNVNAYLLSFMNGLYYFDLLEETTVTEVDNKNITTIYSEGWDSADTLAKSVDKELTETTIPTDSMDPVVQFFRTLAETFQFDDVLAKLPSIALAETFQYVDSNVLFEFIARLVIYQLDTRSHFSLGLVEDKTANREYFNTTFYDLD